MRQSMIVKIYLKTIDTCMGLIRRACKSHPILMGCLNLPDLCLSIEEEGVGRGGVGHTMKRNNCCVKLMVTEIDQIIPSKKKKKTLNNLPFTSFLYSQSVCEINQQTVQFFRLKLRLYIIQTNNTLKSLS